MTYGLLVNTDRPSGAELGPIAEAAQGVGFEAAFVPEVFGREPFACASELLRATPALNVGTAIANVYARDPLAMRSGAETLAELYDNRFILGLGVSNEQANRARGHVWQNPVEKLDAYCAAMRSAPLSVRRDGPDIPVLIAGHGPMLVSCAARNADGAFAYLQTIGFIKDARAILGPGKKLYSMQMCFVSDDLEAARARARKAVRLYLTLPNYHRAWRRQGFSEADWRDAGSDALIDSIVALGGAEKVRARLAEHRAAGASDLLLIPLNTAKNGVPDWGVMRELLA